MVIALFGASDHHFSSIDSRGEAYQDSSRFATSTKPYPLTGCQSQRSQASAASLLAAKKSVCRLRLDLIEMLRISLRVVDYATKAYAFGLVEFARSAPIGRKKIEYLGREIIATIQELREAEELDDLELGFIESAGV